MRLGRYLAIGMMLLVAAGNFALGQTSEVSIDKWVQVTERAAGSDDHALQQAKSKALRKAVEEASGVFLTSQSKTVNYKAVYDKIFTRTSGYVLDSKVIETKVTSGVTVVVMRVRVSTKKFQDDWASIAHTIEEEGNPRLVIAIVETVHQSTHGPSYDVNENGIVQTAIEEFLISKGLTLMDRQTAAAVTKRDILLAAIKDDASEVASLGARFDADVVVTGQANVKYGKTLDVADQKMYQFVATLNVRVIQTDSARVLATKSFPPVTYTALQRSGGEDKALSKLAKECAPDLLSAVVEAWKNRANVSRTVQLSISGMDYEMWKIFKEEAEGIDGVKAVRLREITEGLANIDVEYENNSEALADQLTKLAMVRLTIQEISSNRLKLKVQE